MKIELDINKKQNRMRYYVFDTENGKPFNGELGFFEVQDAKSDNPTYRIAKFTDLMDPVIEKFASSEGLAFDEDKILEWMEYKDAGVEDLWELEEYVRLNVEAT